MIILFATMLWNFSMYDDLVDVPSFGFYMYGNMVTFLVVLISAGRI
jgi:hypothetical protein